MFRLALVHSLRFSLTVVVVRVVMSSEEMETRLCVCVYRSRSESEEACGHK